MCQVACAKGTCKPPHELMVTAPCENLARMYNLRTSYEISVYENKNII